MSKRPRRELMCPVGTEEHNDAVCEGNSDPPHRCRNESRKNQGQNRHQQACPLLATQEE